MSKVQDEKRYGRLLEYVERSGIPTVDRPVSFHAPHRWDGEKLATDFLGVEEKQPKRQFMLLHEVHHWMYAPPRRRRLPDYGLGRGPTSHVTPQKVELAISHGSALFEEQVVATLDVIVFSQLGFDSDDIWEWWYEVWNDHASQVWTPDNGIHAVWTGDGEDEQLDKALAALRKKKLLTPEHEATLERLLGDLLPHTTKTLALARAKQSVKQAMRAR